MKRAIIVFTRVPMEGRTKTRMMPYLTGTECVGLHRAFLQDIGVECKKTGFDIFVYYTDDREINADWSHKDTVKWKHRRKMLVSAVKKHK